MNHLLAFVLSLAGFAALALAMERAQESVFGHGLARVPTRVLRGAGAALLLLALLWLGSAQGWGLGLVLYSGHTSLAAGLVFCALVVWERVK